MLNHHQRAALLQIARTTVETTVRDQAPAISPPSDVALQQPAGAFVTLHQNGELRGCIGLLEADLPLWQTVSRAAALAATQDYRFYPVAPAEVPELRLEISILSPLERTTDLTSIQVGTHGLVAEQGTRRGLLLPQVAREWDWGREDFLSHTCQKAGLGPLAWQQGATIYHFTAQVFGEEADGPGCYLHLNGAEARRLLERHLTAPNLIKHCMAAQAVLGELARRFDEDEPNWRLCGLLHDIDYELTVTDMARHTLVAEELLRKEGINDALIKAVKAHNNLAPRDDALSRALWAVDPLTGFLVAAALMTPEKRLAAVDLPFVLNRLKEKSFARAVSREQVASCEELGLTVESFISLGLGAMQQIAPQLGL